MLSIASTDEAAAEKLCLRSRTKVVKTSGTVSGLQALAPEASPLSWTPIPSRGPMARCGYTETAPPVRSRL